MKSLQESLLDNDDELFKNTSLEGIAKSTFPKKTNIIHGNSTDYYRWKSNGFKDVTKLNIDYISAEWANDRWGNGLIRVSILKENFIDSLHCIDIEANTKDPQKLKELAYSVMELIRDSLFNLRKLIYYCEQKKFKFSVPKLYKIDLYDILNK